MTFTVFQCPKVKSEDFTSGSLWPIWRRWRHCMGFSLLLCAEPVDSMDFHHLLVVVGSRGGGGFVVLHCEFAAGRKRSRERPLLDVWFLKWGECRFRHTHTRNCLDYRAEKKRKQNAAHALSIRPMNHSIYRNAITIARKKNLLHAALPTNAVYMGGTPPPTTHHPRALTLTMCL